MKKLETRVINKALLTLLILNNIIKVWKFIETDSIATKIDEIYNNIIKINPLIYLI